MLTNKVSWNLTTVVAVHLSRIALGLLLVRVVYPLLFPVTPLIIEVTDRLIVLGLVWFAVGRYGGDFSGLGLSFAPMGRAVATGVVVGFILLAVSIFSEKLYTTVLLVPLADHPLVTQVENAATWRGLLVPLFLAGVLAPITEEVLYRLFTFLPMKERWGFWGGAIASSLLFALLHFNLYWLGEMMIVGIGLAFVYSFTGSLLSAIIAHSVINTSKIVLLFWGITFI